MDLKLSPSPHRRWAAAAALTATACIHIALVPAHLHEAPYAGALFIALSTAALSVAILLLTSNHQLAWLGAAALSLTALLAYVISRSTGLPSLADDIGDWLNPLGVAATLSETATALICLHAVLHGSPSSSRRAGTIATNQTRISNHLASAPPQ
jgi:hypothetical protein